MAAPLREGRGKKRARGVKNDEEGSQGPFHSVFWEKSGEAMVVGGMLREVMMSRGRPAVK